MKKAIAGMVCLLLVGCGDDQEITSFKNKHLEGTEKEVTIGSLLFNRPMCSNVSLVKEGELFKYSCDLNNYENTVKEIITKRFTDVERDSQVLINKYKEEIDIATFKLEKLVNIDDAFDELEKAGIIEKYNDVFNNFKMGFSKIDPMGIGEFNAPILDNLDYSLAYDRKLIINYIKGTAIKYGITEEFGKYVYLLEYSKEDRKRIIDEEGKGILKYSSLAKEEIENIKKSTNKELDSLAKFTYTPYIKRLAHRASFAVNDQNVTMPHCELYYVTFDDKVHTATIGGFCKDIFYNADVYETELPKLIHIFINSLLEKDN